MSLTLLLLSQGKYFDSYKAYTTILFTAPALLVGILGVVSRIEVHNQVKDMKTEFEDQKADIQAEFNKLAGDSLKQPNIEILYKNKPLEGQTVIVPFFQNEHPSNANINQLFIQNTGDKTADNVSIRISLEILVRQDWNNYKPNWEEVTSFEQSYNVSYHLKRQVALHPGEIYNIQSLSLDWRKEYGTNTQCKTEVFSNVKEEMVKYREYAKNTLNKNKRNSIRVSEKDLVRLKRRAMAEGIPYQTLITSVLHKFINSTL